VRQLKGNIQRLAYEVFLLEGDKELPDNWEEYEWPIVQEWELDFGDVKRGRPACPFAVERKGEHRKGCECFKPEMIEGWAEEMGE
jgi:hypothetical protein